MTETEYKKAYKEGYRDAISEIAIKLSQYNRTIPQREIAKMTGMSNQQITAAIKKSKHDKEIKLFNYVYKKSKTQQHTIDVWKLFMNVVLYDIPLSQMSEYGEISLAKIHEMIERYNKYVIYKLYPFMPKEKLPPKPDPQNREILQKILEHRLAKYGKSRCLL